VEEEEEEEEEHRRIINTAKTIGFRHKWRKPNKHNKNNRFSP
jgi:hypothetical protein